MREIKHIVIHHSGNTCTVEGIRDLHINKNGWDEVGYHFMIDEKGNAHSGRELDVVGAHVVSHNEHSVGICLLGNFDEQKLSDAQLNGLKEILGHLMVSLGLGKNDISFHRDFPGADKTCPGKNITKEMIL